MRNRRTGIGIFLIIFTLKIILISCDENPVNTSRTAPEDNSLPFLPSYSILPAAIDSTAAARLTERYESAHFIFHYEPGDEIWVARSEAFHEWAVGYLDVTPWKKIDFYKFRTVEDLVAALGFRVGGMAFPEDFALITTYSWHNHECFHLYNSLFCEFPTIRLFEEGMVVAHEFDPFNNVWVSQWNRMPLEEPYIYSEMILDHRANNRLLSIEDLLVSQAFNDACITHGYRLVYDEAGMFVSYVIETYGLEKMKEVFCAVQYNDSLNTILTQFELVLGVSVQDAEAAWLDNLDQFLPKQELSLFTGYQNE